MESVLIVSSVFPSSTSTMKTVFCPLKLKPYFPALQSDRSRRRRSFLLKSSSVSRSFSLAVGNGSVISYSVGVVSDYDLLALDSISGSGRSDTSLFPEVDSTWKTFNEIQKLLSKTNGKVIGELMTPAPLVVRETTNLEDAARLLLETKYRRLPVVDNDGKLVGIITRGNVVRAALEIKREIEQDSEA